MGGDIDGEQLNNYFGYSLSLSGDGLTLVIGAAIEPGIASNGYAKVFKYNGTDWIEQVQINGLSSNDRGGYSVSISDDGSTIAVGAIGNDGGGLMNSGQVRIFKNISGSSWVQQGAINGEAASDLSGWSVSLNSDGTIVAIGAINNDAGGSIGNNRGHTRMFQFTGGTWTQIGADINGEASGDVSGCSVSLSDDGLTVAIGANYNDGNGTTSGHTRIYQFNGSFWTQVASDIDGDGGYDYAGGAVSLSSDGQTVAVGAIGNGDNGNFSGQVKVFSYTTAPTFSNCTSMISNFPYSEDFESFSSCSTTPAASCPLANNWVNQTNDDIDWTTNNGGTTSSNTGPSNDFNPGTSSGNYLYLESSNSGHPSKEAIVTPPCFDLTSVYNAELGFAYHMYGNTMGTMYVDVSVDSGANYTNIWSLSGNQGNLWNQAFVDLSSFDGQTIKIRFRGVTGGDYFSDMAIDDITLEGDCPLAASTTGDFRCGAGTVDLSAAPGTGGTDCAWYTTMTGGTPFFTGTNFTTPSISATTTYYVSSVNASCESSTRTPVIAEVINSLPAPIIMANNPTSFCFGDSVTLTSSETIGIQWFLNGSPITGATNPSYTANLSGNYTVEVSASSCSTVSSSQSTVTVFALPTQGTDVQTACVSYTWIDGVTYTSSNNSALFTIAGGGVNGCDSTVMLDLTINQLSSSVDVHNACGSFTWIDGNTYMASNNVATYVIPSGGANGCDSVVTLDLTLTPDITAPVPDISVLSDVVSLCSVTTLTAPLATDNCVGTVIAAHSASFPITQSTTITWTYDDGNGNTSTQTQNVIITDATAPVADIASLSPITAECQVSNIPAPTATDNCAGSISGTPNVTFPITTQGTFTVTWTYDDGNGNTSTQTQDVTIDDATSPTADNAILSDITAACEVTSLTAPTATDNCAGAITGTHNATLPITTQGTTTVTWTYDDGNGNTSTQTQDVVITDITAPAADLANLADITSECEVTPTAPSATDDCVGALTGTPDVSFPITASGTTTVTWTYDDGNGNTSTQAQDVIITPIDVNTTTTPNGTDYTISADASGYTYQWIENCGTTNDVISGATSQDYTPTTNGTYAVIFDNGTCSDTSACVAIGDLSVENNQLENQILVFPNPTNGIVHIEAVNEIQKISITNALGQEVMSMTLTNQKNHTIELPEEPGVYLISVSSSLQENIVRVIKQ